MAETTQRALEIHEVGGRLKLVTNRAIPSPEPRQILVQVTVAGLNPHDQKSRDNGLFIADTLPAVLANDVVGRVHQLGSEVTSLQVGDRVVGQAGFEKSSAQNGLQTYALLDADFTTKIPDTISDDEAATIPTNIMAPVVALFGPNCFNFPPPWSKEAKASTSSDASLLIIGGGSNCGRFAVQLASLAGVGTIVVLGGDETELKRYGATKVLDRSGSPNEIIARIKRSLPQGAQYTLDTVNPPALQHIGINASSAGAKCARLLPIGEPDAASVTQKDYQLVNVFGSSHVYPDLSKEFWSHLRQYLLDGSIQPTNFQVVEGLDADATNRALDAYRDGKRVVKTHIHVS